MLKSRPETPPPKLGFSIMGSSTRREARTFEDRAVGGVDIEATEGVSIGVAGHGRS